MTFEEIRKAHTRVFDAYQNMLDLLNEEENSNVIAIELPIDDHYNLVLAFNRTRIGITNSNSELVSGMYVHTTDAIIYVAHRYINCLDHGQYDETFNISDDELFDD